MVCFGGALHKHKMENHTDIKIYFVDKVGIYRDVPNLHSHSPIRRQISRQILP